LLVPQVKPLWLFVWQELLIAQGDVPLGPKMVS
jgi:hypothetical protein